ncbi:MAG TPA: PEGA domain-containing protein [Kofleriaceae bacterium]
MKQFSIGLFLLACAFGRAARADSTAARTDTSTVIVIDKNAHEQTVIAAAITGALRQAQWSVIDLPFTPKEVAAIAECLVAAQPWPCVEPYAKARGVSTLVVVQATEESGGLRLDGQIALASSTVPSLEQQHCNPCTDTSLARTSASLAKLLVDGMPKPAAAGVTGIEVRTMPAGASVTLDEQPATAVAGVVAAAPGKHRVVLRLAGYEPITRDVVVVGGGTLTIDETFQPARASSGHPYLVPALVIGGGAAAVIVGTAVSLTAEPGPRDQRHEHYYSTPGIVVAGVGGLAIVGGIYLLLRHHSHATSGPTMSLAPGGAVGGWSGSF